MEDFANNIKIDLKYLYKTLFQKHSTSSRCPWNIYKN